MKISKKQQLNDLYSLLLMAKDEKEIADLLGDLCTPKELKSIAERWNIVRLLNQGESYRQVSILTGASTTTVTRVAYWMRHGRGAYKKFLERFNKKSH